MLKRLPIGKQDFPSLIEGGFLYVDKTQLIHTLTQKAPYIFMARPRRFGKSLLVSTLITLFKGQKEYFKNLWIEDKVDWKIWPVVHIDFNKMDYLNLPLEEELARTIDEEAAKNGVQLHQTGAKSKFAELLGLLGKSVVLIDEYDKAITDCIENHAAERMHHHIDILKNFYGTLKSADPYLHFVFITGVSKFGKVSIFSDLNNLYDATEDQSLAQITGWTQTELETNFMPYLTAVAQETKQDISTILQAVKNWYNGYSWDGVTTLYNPFSILNYLNSGGTLRNYWFSTGTPTFLTKMLRQKQMPSYRFEDIVTDSIILDSADVSNIDLDALLLQTGYLTIKSIERNNDRLTYHLTYPNQEVKQAFLKYILAEYLQLPPQQANNTYTQKIQTALVNEDLSQFFEILHSIYAAVPYQITGDKESYFHSILHVVLSLTGYLVYSEIPTNKGRMDAVLDIGQSIYIFECKLHDSEQTALQQIKNNDYAQRFQQSGKKIVLVGIAFSAIDKNIKNWVSEVV
jgi:hypothetical protein